MRGRRRVESSRQRGGIGVMSAAENMINLFDYYFRTVFVFVFSL